MTIKILIADDSRLIRECLRTLFLQTEIQVAAEASTAVEALKLARERQLHVVLLDIRMPGGSGFETLRQIKSERPELPILIHSTFDDAFCMNRSRELGASDYLVKGGDACQLIDAIRRAAGRETRLPDAG